jgi:hypothetical protein
MLPIAQRLLTSMCALIVTILMRHVPAYGEPANTSFCRLYLTNWTLDDH